MKFFACCLPLLAMCAPLHAQERISHGRFKDVTLYRPKGDVKQFVLFLSGDNGWDRPVTDMAQMLAAKGAMVAGINMPQLVASLEADGDQCVFPDGDLENLSHYVQGYARLSAYHTPLLVGYSSGATLAYAMIAQAPAQTFLGAISLGFCPDLDLAKPLCRGEDVHFTRHKDGLGMDLLPAKKLSADWIALHGTHDRVCSTAAARRFAAKVPNAKFVELPNVTHDYPAISAWQPQFLSAYDQLTANAEVSMPLPTTLSDLPLVEVRAETQGSTCAILLSGDGGWAGLDKKVAAALADKGVDVVGLDSLRYFWSKRTPQSLANDLDRAIRYYAAQWRKSKVVLIGYSQGADVLPFAMNRLPAASKKLVAHMVLMGLGTNAAFEFHVGNWLGGDEDTIPILPEASKLNARNTFCLYGADEEEDSLCPKLAPAHAYAQSLPGGHHFDGAYEELAALILERISNTSH